MITAADFVPATEVGGGPGLHVGRFGLKANNPSLIEQSVGAYLEDMGITSDFAPEEVVHPLGNGVSIGDNVADGRAIVEMSSSIRDTANRLQEDLDAITVPARPWPEPGSGLGLYISRRIVRAHGGHMTVVGNPGGGSAFVFTLPLVVAGVERMSSVIRHRSGTTFLAVPPSIMVAVIVVHDWRLSAIVLAVLGVLGLPMVRLSQRLRRVSRRAQEATADVGHRASEAIGAAAGPGKPEVYAVQTAAETLQELQENVQLFRKRLFIEDEQSLLRRARGLLVQIGAPQSCLLSFNSVRR